MCIYTYFQEHIDMPHDPLTRVSECSVAGSAPEILMTAMVLQAGVETRSAMAFYVDLADYTASADKAYADAEPTVCRMDEWSFLDRWRKRGQSADSSSHPMTLGAGRLNG